MIQPPLKKKTRRRTVIAALLALILLLPFWWWTGLWYQDKLLAEKRAQIGEYMAVQGRSLSTEINSRLAILKALKTFVDARVGAGQVISDVEFSAFASGLLSGENGVHNLSIAPGGITEFLFPSGSSERLAGHDLTRDPRPQIRTAVQRAIRLRGIVITGPDALPPKGLGLVARQAVYQKERWWGLITLVLDLPPILTQAGLDSRPSGLEIALLDRSDRLFFGNKAALEENPISFQVDLPDGTWKLLALPEGGWSAAVEKSLLHFRGLTLTLAFLIAVLAGLAAGYQMQVTMAVRQRTGSLQRSLTDHRETEENLNRTLVNLRRAMGATLSTLVQAVDAKDPASAGHQKRVADLARTIATEMGLAEEVIEGIRTAALIHDIGKIPLPAEILGKPGKLSESEFQLVKTHAQTGYDMLKDGEFPWPVARMVWQHHERMDGSGYPLGLKGEEILQGSRVLAVADVVEAMASPRSYRPLPGLEKALDEILAQRGILYDPDVVDACRSIFLDKDFRLDV